MKHGLGQGWRQTDAAVTVGVSDGVAPLRAVGETGEWRVLRNMQASLEFQPCELV